MKVTCTHHIEGQPASAHEHSVKAAFNQYLENLRKFTSSVNKNIQNNFEQ